MIVVEAEKDIGGHAITSGGNVPLGGGTSAQKKYGIDDSPDLLFRDLTDWSMVEPNGFPDYRYNDREIVRAFADNSAPTYEWLVAHGVVFVDKAPDALGGNGVGNSVPREMHAAAMHWPLVQTGERADPAIAATRSTGNGLMRPLEVAAKAAGVQILLEHRMTAIHREMPGSGRVLGIAVNNNGNVLNIRARKAVIIATGGQRECQVSPDVRSASDRGILRSCRNAVVRSGRQRRDRGDGDRCFAVGAFQSDRRVRHPFDQARRHRDPIQLSQSQMDAGQCRVRTRPRGRPCCGGLAGRDSGQYAGPAVL